MGVENYIKWVYETARYFKLNTETILDSDFRTATITKAKQVFYILCIRDKISIYKLSTELGKHRNTIWRSIKEYKVNVSSIVNEIIENAK